MPCGNPEIRLCRRKWLGVRASKSSGSSDAATNGRLFIMNSTSANKVLRANSFNSGSPVIIFRCFFAVCTKRSHTPDIWGVAGGWNTHFIRLFIISLSISFWSNSSRVCRNSRFAPTKLVPLSDRISFGGPLRLINWRRRRWNHRFATMERLPRILHVWFSK